MSDSWKIKSVIAVETPQSKKDWFPSCKEVDGLQFFRFGKFDRGVIVALTGKGLELRASKSPHLLDGKQYDQIVSLRNNECNKRYQECMAKAAEQIGEEWHPTKKGMLAKDDHRLIVAQYVTVDLPLVQRNGMCAGPLQAQIPCAHGVHAMTVCTRNILRSCYFCLKKNMWVHTSPSLLGKVHVGHQDGRAMDGTAVRSPAVFVRCHADGC